MSLLPGGFFGGGGGGGAPAYEIEKSLRFRASATAYLERTPSTGSGGNVWTWSGWLKRGAFTGSTEQIVFNAGFYVNSANRDVANISIFQEQLRVSHIVNSTMQSEMYTTALLRDPSAHYHIFVRRNAATYQIYINGVLQTVTGVVGPAATNDLFGASGRVHRLGAGIPGLTPFPVDGYLSEINFIDGQALTPNDFGETDPVTGVWVPKAYTGTYGTNGFYLPFNDGTNLTNLCLDRSGNGNNWTANNISLTAGATYDWMDDTPTNNFAVLNPVGKVFGTSTAVPSNGNLTLSWSNGASITGQYYSSIMGDVGKVYFEVNIQTQSYTAAASATSDFIRITDVDKNTLDFLNYQSSGGVRNTLVQYNGSTIDTVSGATAGQTMSFTIDTSTGEVGFYINNSLIGAYTNLSSAYYWQPGCGTYSSGTSHYNFGQRPFAYTPPTGFLPLCTKNIGTIAPISSGSFTGNANADGPFVWLAGTPDTMTINGNAVTWGTHADRLANGFKVRTSSASYNAAGTNTFSVSSFVDDFTDPNRAKANP